MEKHLAYFTHEDTEVGHLYYFAPADRAPGPYLKQVHAGAIIDFAADGTLGGVELIEWMPPPPNRIAADYSDADALRDLQESILQSTTIADFMAVKKTVEAIRSAEQ